MTSGNGMSVFPRKPPLALVSDGFTPDARTRIRSSPGPGLGVGRASTLSTAAAGPFLSYQAARIIGLRPITSTKLRSSPLSRLYTGACLPYQATDPRNHIGAEILIESKSRTNPTAAPQLHRVIGTFDLVLLNIAAIVSFRWLAVAARIGPSSLTLWVLGLITFLIPSALAVLELSSRCPGEGGVYLWSRAAFGERHAFLAGWSYWISNLVYFPSLLLFMAGVFLYLHGNTW